MANRLETALRAHREALRAIDRAAMAEVFSAYTETMERIEPLIELVQQEVERQGVATAAQLFRLERYQELQRQIAVEMERLGRLTGDVTQQAQARAIRESIDAQRVIAIASARGSQAAAQIAVGWVNLPVFAVEDLIGATRSGPLADLIASFGEETARVLTNELVSGLALGTGPRKVASAIHRATEIGRNRALLISRTEMMRASRAATKASYAQNSDVLSGWYWVSAKQARSCAACLAMDGTFHPLSETLESHPACRCAMRPALKNVPMRSVPTGDQWLREQPADVQDAVLGKAGGMAYRAGEVELSDFVRVDESETWGRSIRDGGIGWARLNAARDRRIAA